MQGGKSGCGPLFDIDVNHNEPLFVNAAIEVLNERNIAALDGPFRVEAEIIVQRITGITEHGRTTQALCNLIPRNRYSLWQDFRWMNTGPNVGVAQIAQESHRPFPFALVPDHVRG